MKRLTYILLLVASVLLGGCRNLIFEYEGDCTVTYRLKMVYTRNMKWANAFSHEVKSVRLFVFDSEDELVWTTVESGEALAAEDYAIELPLPPGDYHLIAWCGADNNPGDETFDVSHVSTRADVAVPDDAGCIMVRQHDSAGAYSDRLLHPLFHGEMNLTLDDYSYEGGTHTYIMELTKDTNDIRIILQQINGEDIDVNLFNFTITDANGIMYYNNHLAPDESISYRAWHKSSGKAGIEVKDPYTQSLTASEVNIALAEISIPRMMVSHRRDMILEITRKQDGIVVAKIPVIDYALLVKGYEREGLLDQEYLDRQDEYSMMFFLDANYKWISSSIIVNSWRLVLQNQELGNR